MRWWRRRDGQLDADADAAAFRDELLSAYLDAQLGPDDLAALAVELAADPQSREALEGMREVKAALAALGEVRAPRAFTLTASPAPARGGLGRIELGARVGAVTAAVAFVLVLGGDLRGGASEPVSTGDTAASSVSPAEESASGQLAAPDATGAVSAPAPPLSTPAGNSASTLASPVMPTRVVEQQSGTPATLLAPAGEAAVPPPAGAGREVAPTAPTSASATTTAATGMTAQRLNEVEDSPASGGAEAAPPIGADVSEPSTVPSSAPLDPASEGSAPSAVPDAPKAAADAGMRGFNRPSVGSQGADAPAPAGGLEWRVTVKRSTGLDALRTTEAGLAALALVLALVAVWLWYLRRHARIQASEY